MSQRQPQPVKPADVNYLVRELRRLSTESQEKSGAAFWRVMRWHLRGRRNGDAC
jgi:hypothetical protein